MCERQRTRYDRSEYEQRQFDEAEEELSVDHDELNRRVHEIMEKRYPGYTSNLEDDLWIALHFGQINTAIYQEMKKEVDEKMKAIAKRKKAKKKRQRKNEMKKKDAELQN